MKVETVCVGMPRIVEAGPEQYVSTGIFKERVEGSVRVGELNLEGDGQPDLTVHGGRNKAVYVYPSEHYEFWRRDYPAKEFTDAQFGENLSTSGLLETEIYIGDRLTIGTAEFVITQPRLPCYKLGIRFGHSDILRRFLQSRRTGFYLAVEKTGELAADDPVGITSRDENRVSVDDIVRVFAADRHDRETIERALLLPDLPESWKRGFRERLA